MLRLVPYLRDKTKSNQNQIHRFDWPDDALHLRTSSANRCQLDVHENPRQKISTRQLPPEHVRTKWLTPGKRQPPEQARAPRAVMAEFSFTLTTARPPVAMPTCRRWMPRIGKLEWPANPPSVPPFAREPFGTYAGGKRLYLVHIPSLIASLASSFFPFIFSAGLAVPAGCETRSSVAEPKIGSLSHDTNTVTSDPQL